MSNDELIVLDAMFRHGMPFWAFRQARYAIHLNAGYTHSFDDKALRSMLEEFVQRGLLNEWQKEESPTPDDRSFSFTAAGGALWESERQPIWDAYCSNYQLSEEMNDDGSGVFHLEAFSVSAIQAFLLELERYYCWHQAAEPIANAVFTQGREEPLISWMPEKPVIEAAIKIRGVLPRMSCGAPGTYGPPERQRWWVSLSMLDRVRFERE